MCSDDEAQKDVKVYGGRYRQFLCWPRNNNGWKIDKIVSDQVIEKGGEKYRWIRYVTSRVGHQNPFDIAWRKANGWPEGVPFKESSVYKFGPFEDKWKVVDDLGEAVPINQEFKKNKAAAFFGQAMRGTR